MEEKSFIVKFVECLDKPRNEWTREDTKNAIDYLHGIFYFGELNKENTKNMYQVTKHILNAYYGEIQTDGKGYQYEFQSEFRAIAVKLGLITTEQSKEMVKRNLENLNKINPLRDR